MLKETSVTKTGIIILDIHMNRKIPSNIYWKSTIRFFDKTGVSLLRNYAVQSPDLSIVENVWKLLKDRIHNRHPTKIDCRDERRVGSN